jgi:hypothetical protein
LTDKKLRTVISRNNKFILYSPAIKKFAISYPAKTHVFLKISLRMNSIQFDHEKYLFLFSTFHKNQPLSQLNSMDLFGKSMNRFGRMIE